VYVHTTFIIKFYLSQVFILVCLFAWFSKTETCHRLMTNLFQSDMASLTDSPVPQLQLPLPPPPVTPPIHGEGVIKRSRYMYMYTYPTLVCISALCIGSMHVHCMWVHMYDVVCIFS
jgi:hypothetical protein